MIIYGQGALYDGCVRNNQMTGYGRRISRNRQAYIEEFKDGKFHGFGVLRHLVPAGVIYHRGFLENYKGNG